MQVEKDYYAICRATSPGLLEESKYISIDSHSSQIRVNTSCLGTTPEGFLAVRFHVMRLEKGLALGIVYNCEDAGWSGFRMVPIDSLSPMEKVRPYHPNNFNLSNSPHKDI